MRSTLFYVCQLLHADFIRIIVYVALRILYTIIIISILYGVNVTIASIYFSSNIEHFFNGFVNYY